MSSIEKLVDGTSGHGMLSLMDAYSGYNQIRMHAVDENKTAFCGENSNYCHKTMSFGLKKHGKALRTNENRLCLGLYNSLKAHE